MIQIENTIRVRFNNKNDETRIYDISADVEINREAQTARIYSGNVRTDDKNVATFSKHDESLNVNYYDLEAQAEVNNAINGFVAEVQEKVATINF